jgi:hypothetical protein
MTCFYWKRKKKSRDKLVEFVLLYFFESDSDLMTGRGWQVWGLIYVGKGKCWKNSKISTSKRKTVIDNYLVLLYHFCCFLPQLQILP